MVHLACATSKKRINFQKNLLLKIATVKLGKRSILFLANEDRSPGLLFIEFCTV